MNTHTVEKLQTFARTQKNGEFLSTQYIRNDTLYKWKCSENHEFEMTWLSIYNRGIWCKYCRHGSISELRKFAESKDLELISNEWKTKTTMYKWKCLCCEYQFERSWWNMKISTGKCEKCSNTSVFNEMKKWATNKRGELLSDKFIRIKDNYKWRCENKHEWEAMWRSVKWNGNWCPHCYNENRCWTLEKVKIFAIKNECECIDILKGEGSDGYYLWKCKNGHITTPKGSTIFFKPDMCKFCHKLDITEMKEIAISREGECLSEEYTNSRSDLKWKCKEGHEWEAKAKSVKGGTWCPECVVNNRRWSLEDIREIAKSHGGELISTVYEDLCGQLDWRCKEGHEWRFRLATVLTDAWCQTCHLDNLNRERRLKAIVIIGKFIKSMKGKLITTTDDIIDRTTDHRLSECHVKIQCQYDHEFKITLQSLRSGTWCLYCRYKSESMCHDIMEDILGLKFIKKRPKWLDNLELDGYCEDKNIAFEYNGLQHYKYVKFFHREGIKSFRKQQERDQRKYRLCKENNIKLIIISSEYSYNKPTELREYIEKELIKFGLISEITFED